MIGRGPDGAGPFDLQYSRTDYTDFRIDGVLESGGIEPAVHDRHLVRDDWVQAVVYEALLRAPCRPSDTLVNSVTPWGYAGGDYIYASQRVIRDDLGHSIRTKDAECVFDPWTTVIE